MASQNAIGNIIPDADFTVSNGDVILSAGNVSLPTTSSTVGRLTINSVDFVHGFGTRNYWFGPSGNFTLSGTDNTAVGVSMVNLTSGIRNSCVGQFSGWQITSGGSNCCLGYNSAANIRGGSRNVSIGADNLATIQSNNDNVAVGYGVMFFNVGDNNVGVGASALNAATTATNSVAIGYQALNALTTGGYNIAVGYQAGSSLATSDADNILIGNTGTATDNNTIRIGTQGTGNGQQDSCYIAGIYNVTPASSTQEVVVVSDGHEMGSINYTVSTSFTPVLNFGGATTGITYSLQTGRYARVGNIVTFAINIVLTSKGTATGAATVTGLPLTPSVRSPMNLLISNLTFADQVFAVHASGPSATINISQAASGGAVTQLTDAEFANNTTLFISGSYLV